MALVATPRAVILDTESSYKPAWQNAAIECGYDLNDDFYLTLVGQPNPACEAALLDRFGNRFPLDDFRVRWESLWRELVETSGIPTKPGLKDLLLFLREKELPLAIATSSDRDYVS